MKLIVERASQKVVGCHILEPSAGEMIQMVGVAMKAGATKQNFDETIGVHPTAAEEMVCEQRKYKRKKRKRRESTRLLYKTVAGTERL